MLGFGGRVADISGIAGSVLPSRLLLIRLTQQTPISSVEGCCDYRFLERYGSFKASSPPRKPANNISRPAAGPMASFAPDADIGERTNW
jgi:hypothetical protein